MRFLKSFLVFSIVMLLISGCKSAQNSSTKQAITSPDTSLQETASSTAPAANELSPSISPAPRVQKTPSASPKPKNAKWIYNRKTHVLTIKGTEEMYAEQTEDWIDNERKFDEHNGIQLNFNERKVPSSIKAHLQLFAMSKKSPCQIPSKKLTTMHFIIASRCRNSPFRTK